MEYIGFKIRKTLRKTIDKYIEANGYTSISEFIRESMRFRMESQNNLKIESINGGKDSKKE